MPTGPKTRMWTYGGSFPGPTIKRPAGSVTRVTFINNLPKRAGAMTVHQHGGHQSSADDGQPTRQLIATGSRRTYTYPLTDAGKPAPAGFRFYHDHRMGRTAANNWRGLQGMFLVTDKRERRLGLPHGAYDVPAFDRPQPDAGQPADRPLPRSTHARLDDRTPGAPERRDGGQTDPRQRPVRAVPARRARAVPAPPPTPPRSRPTTSPSPTVGPWSRWAPAAPCSRGAWSAPTSCSGRPNVPTLSWTSGVWATRTSSSRPSRAPTRRTAPARGPRRSCSSGSAGRRTRAPGCRTTCGRCQRSTSPRRSPRSGRSG